jgi:hypothetical protein
VVSVVVVETVSSLTREVSDDSSLQKLFSYVLSSLVVLSTGKKKDAE